VTFIRAFLASNTFCSKFDWFISLFLMPWDGTTSNFDLEDQFNGFDFDWGTDNFNDFITTFVTERQPNPIPRVSINVINQITPRQTFMPHSRRRRLMEHIQLQAIISR
jgi:hypothetical protein